MENKINIAELLKDCPKGMELNCLLWDNVTFERVADGGIWIKHIDSKSGEHPLYVYNDGSFPIHNLGSFRTKCVIFPKGKTTWEGFVPPCKFKDGDVIASIDSRYTSICIFKGEGLIKGTVNYYCGIDAIGELFIKDIKDQDEHFGEIDEYDFATEEEKQKLFDAIKANGYKWNEETKTLEKLIKPKFKVGDKIKRKGLDNIYSIEITAVTPTIYTFKGGGFQYIENTDKNYELSPNKFDITTLKPFDKVLYRQRNGNTWLAQLYSNYAENVNKHILLGCIVANHCIPYEDNEHLLGTTNDCDEFYKTWE